MAIKPVHAHHAGQAPTRTEEACQTAFHALLTRSRVFQDAPLVQIVLHVLLTQQQMAQPAIQTGQAVYAKLGFIVLTQARSAWSVLLQVLNAPNLETLFLRSERPLDTIEEATPVWNS